MADKPQVIDSYDFGAIKVGELQHYSFDVLGRERNGYFPQTTLVPTFIRYKDILPLMPEYNSETNQKWEQFREATFSSMDEVVLALNSTYNLLVTNIYWLWGAPDVGGLGILQSGPDSYRVVTHNGFRTVNDRIAPINNSLYITYPREVTISNTIPETYRVGELSNIPPSGTYDTGISFYISSEWDDNAYTSYFDNVFRFNACTILNCNECYTTKDNPHIEVYSFSDVGSNLYTSWMHNFTNTFPPENILQRAIWQLNKDSQWAINSFYPYWGIVGLNDATVEGTGIFGGESAAIDTEGNPYEVFEPSGGSSGGGGWQGRYSEDTLPEGVPALNLLNSGFVKLYNPTLSEVQQFASFLFSGITESMESVIKRMMVNPIDYILALNMIHIPLTVNTPEDIGFCGISSGVSANVVTEQYYQLEYHLDIKEFWNTALDYSNYTKCKIYVPYCGIYDISIDEIQNGTLFLRYVVDAVSGSVVAFVGTRRVQKDGTVLRATLYQYNGNCILSMPVSQTNWQNTFSSVLNIASMAIAPSPATAVGMAESVMGQKVSVSKSGSISANFGYLGKQTPYVILERPELSIPVDYGHHEGYPNNRKMTLSGVKGYTEIKTDTLISNKFSGTSEEMDILKSKLEGGVYL